MNCFVKFPKLKPQLLIISGSGELEFEEFVTLASRFMVEEDAEAMQQELKEAFRLYDKEGTKYIQYSKIASILAARFIFEVKQPLLRSVSGWVTIHDTAVGSGCL